MKWEINCGKRKRKRWKKNNKRTKKIKVKKHDKIV